MIIFIIIGGFILLSKLFGKSSSNRSAIEKKQVRTADFHLKYNNKNKSILFNQLQNNNTIFRCSNCFDCPCCAQTLSIRSGQVLLKPAQPSGGEEETKPATKKVYYLSCSMCRWSSRDAGIPDQTMGVLN